MGERVLEDTMTERLVTTAAGRTIRVREAGDPAGRPILMHHGSPGSGLLYERHAAVAAADGIRLVGFDRSGYGGSTPAARGSFADVIDEVVAVADGLGIDRFATWGISGGGPHALACAALLPDRVVAAAALASCAPFDAEGLDFFAGMGESNVEETKKALAGREATRGDAESQREELLAAGAEGVAAVWVTLVSDADRAVLTGELAAYMYATFVDGLGPGVDGWLDDNVAFVSPWGFDLASIEVPVLVRHGAQDRFVPRAHGEWLAAHVPGCEARLTEDDGHLTIMQDLAPVHAWLAARF